MDDKFLQSRLADLAGQSDRRDIYTFSDFLSPSEAALVCAAAGRVPFRLWGGMEGCERDAETVVERYLAVIDLVALGEDLVPFRCELEFLVFYAGIFHFGHFNGLLSISCDRDS